MTPGIYNISVEQGTTLTREFTLTETDIDLTLYDSIRMQIRPATGSSVIWDSEGTTPGGSITIEDASHILLDIAAETTQSWTFDSAAYGIELVMNSTTEVVDRIIKGKIILTREFSL